jgi:2-oxoacid:acceptor oxidoreductase gamma subunit (pyruvate/2-ketoisovalerate family)/2-oxoacid:acceptor oxidoreductase delta subunit (pyruvate/2-ketoisovalerate family)
MYGTERRGAPLTAFVRINSKQIKERELVHEPDISIVLDPLLSKQQAVVDNLKPGGLVLLNTIDDPKKVQLTGNFEIATVDATTIALNTLGRPITNTAILGALAKVTGIVKLFSVEKAIKKYFPGKLGDLNIDAVRRSFEKVKGPVKALQGEGQAEKVDINIGGYGILKDVSSWRVFTPEIDEQLCVDCMSCWLFCPETAIEWDEDKNKPKLVHRKCKGCGICAEEWE